MAYGFLARYLGDVRRDRYLMPASAAAPLSDFKLYGLFVWPDPFSEQDVLLSLKVLSKEGLWKEQLPCPEPLRRYTPPIALETALACAPTLWHQHPGRFFTWVGDTPLGVSALVNSPQTSAALESTPAGPVAVKWSGGLRGLLLLGSR